MNFECARALKINTHHRVSEKLIITHGNIHTLMFFQAVSKIRFLCFTMWLFFKWGQNSDFLESQRLHFTERGQNHEKSAHSCTLASATCQAWGSESQQDPCISHLTPSFWCHFPCSPSAGALKSIIKSLVSHLSRNSVFTHSHTVNDTRCSGSAGSLLFPQCAWQI